MTEFGAAYAEAATDVIIDFGMATWVADMLGALLRRRADLDRQIERLRAEMLAEQMSRGNFR